MFERLLAADGPINYTCKIPMRSITDPLSPIYPPTYPPPEGSNDKATYNISDRGLEPNCCVLDSEGSQANRMEELFKTSHSDLVPQVTIMAGGELVNAIDLNHRIADAVLKTTKLSDKVEDAMARFGRDRVADGIAAILPTSLVFGFWDSRPTSGQHCKWPRLVQSTIRAFDVHQQVRSSQFHECKPATRAILDMAGLDRDNLDRPTVDALQNRGLLDCPNPTAIGGVYVRGGIYREVVIDLCSIRALRSATDTHALQRYVLGLALVALTTPQTARLRQGCTLVPDLDKPATQIEWYADGTQQSSDLLGLRQEIDDFARAAASKFRTSPVVAEIEQDKVTQVLAAGAQKSAKKNGKAGKQPKPKAQAEFDETDVVELT
jgi:CRISPR-associated protein Csb1